MKSGSLLILALLLGFSSVAQLQQPARLEIPITDQQDIRCFNSGEDGVYLIQASQDIKQREIVWDMHFVDTTLSIRNSIQFRYNNSRRYLINASHNGDPYFLFANFQRGVLEIIHFDNPTGDTTVYSIVNPFAFSLADFHVTDEAALLTGYYKEKPIILHYSFARNRVKVVPGLYIDRSQLVQIKTNEDSSFDVIIREPTPNRRRGIAVRRYSPNGVLMFESRIHPTDKNLLYGRALSLPSGEILVTGTYTPGRNDFSRGIFVANVSLSGAYKIRYYNYADLENFFSYMRDGKEARVKKRIERRKVSGKKLRFSYRMLVHNLLPHNDKYIMVGEAFYPKYQSTSIGAIAYRSYDRAFLEGYKYTHAVVIGFDANGDLVMDNSFEIKDVLSRELKQFVYADNSNEGIVLLYTIDEEIRTKYIQESRMLDEKSTEPIALRYSNDQLIESDEKRAGFEKWFGDNYYAYGVQKIKNLRDTQVAMNRKVFYLNKITYN